MRRRTKWVAVFVISFLVVVIAVNAYSYAVGSSENKTITQPFSIDYPLPNSPLVNVITYNGSMHIDMLLYSNGSITQGQRVIVDASGGMTSKFSKQVKQIIIQFQGAQACYLEGCKGEVIEIGGPAGVILNQNRTSPGLAPITEIGPVVFPISLGIGSTSFGGYPIFWPSAGTYYPLMTLSYWNGTDSPAYTLQSMPVYVAPHPVVSPQDLAYWVNYIASALVLVLFVAGTFIALKNKTVRKKLDTWWHGG